MKKLLSIFAFAAVLFACSPEEIKHPSESSLPSAADYTPIISVDQETNQVTFSIDAKSVIPVWLFQDKNGDYTERHAENGYQKIFASMGDYMVRMQVMNSSGTSPDYVERSFHIDNTIVNFDKYLTFFAGTESKEWRLKGEVAGHMGCGESGTTGTNWWSAETWVKESTGIYDDRMVFDKDGTYTYKPGDDGMTYVNKDVTKDPGHAGETDDYNAAFAETATTYEFSVEGEDIFVTLGKAAFCYFPNDSFIDNPKFRIESANTKTIDLVTDNGAIAWHFTLSSEAPDNSGKPFDGFKYNAESNLWLPADAAHTDKVYYNPDPNWGGLVHDGPDYSGLSYDGNGTYRISLPSASYQTWQAQLHLMPVTPLATSASTRYDFSVKITSSTDIAAATIKVCSGDDSIVLLDETGKIALTAYEEKVYYASDVEGKDISDLKVVFDFGGNPDNTEVTISNIVLKDHSVDDGTVLPETGGPDTPGAVIWTDYASDANLWYAARADVNNTLHVYYNADPNWGNVVYEGDSYEGAVNNGNGRYTLTWAQATYNTWQAQFHIYPAASPAVSADKHYDFKVKITSSTDVPAATVKVCSGDDKVVLVDETGKISLKAYEEFVYEGGDLEGKDISDLKVVFDFGGCPDNTEVVIDGIILQEHNAVPGDNSGDGTAFVYNDASNLWLAADAAHGSKIYYNADPNWGNLVYDGIDGYSDLSYDGNGKYTVRWPYATYNTWQAQFHIIPSTPVVLTAEKNYDFAVKITSSTDIAAATIKVCSGDDSIVLLDETGKIALAAYEELHYQSCGLAGKDISDLKVVFDFGGNPENTEVEISEIVLREHQGSVTAPGDSGEPAAPVYNAATNLWKPVDDAVAQHYFYYLNPGWNGVIYDETEGDTAPFLTVDGGKYTLALSEGTDGRWQRQFFIHPKSGHEVALSAGRKYNVQFTVNSDNAFTAFFKIAAFNPDGAPKYEGATINELGEFAIPAGESKDVSIMGFDGADAANVILVWDFGTNPAGTTLVLSNIIIEEA